MAILLDSAVLESSSLKTLGDLGNPSSHAAPFRPGSHKTESFEGPAWVTPACTREMFPRTALRTARRDGPASPRSSCLGRQGALCASVPARPAERSARRRELSGRRWRRPRGAGGAGAAPGDREAVAAARSPAYRREPRKTPAEPCRAGRAGQEFPVPGAGPGMIVMPVWPKPTRQLGEGHGASDSTAPELAAPA